MFKILRISYLEHCCRLFNTSISVQSNQKFYFLSKHLNINENEAEFLCLKQPTVAKLQEEDLTKLFETVNELGYPKNVLLEYPGLFSILPTVLKYRHKVLVECGIENVLPIHLQNYFNLVKQIKIYELKDRDIIKIKGSIENRLASYMTQWPSSLTTLIYGDADTKTLHQLRMKIIQKYFELVLDLSEDKFLRGITTYPTIKQRPLSFINESLNLLQSTAMLQSSKIRNNLYLVHSDPDNLKNIIYKLRSIAGIDVKEIIRLHPRIAMKNYKTLLEMKTVLKEFGISNEAQRKCFEIYTLSPETVRKRLQNALEVPEFQVLFNHQRFLKIVYYNKNAISRMRKLYESNKKCVSLNILSGSSKAYESFVKAPGDRLGNGKDLVFFISQSLGSNYSPIKIRNILKKHPYWIHVPVVQVKTVFEKLSKKFTPQDIFENVTILIYPWKKINDVLKKVQSKDVIVSSIFEFIDYDILNKSQILSLVLYILEKNHYFSGNGVWTEDQSRNVNDLKQSEVLSCISVHNKL